MFFRLSDQSRGLAFSFGWGSNITANFQVPLCQATVEGGGKSRRGDGGRVREGAAVLLAWEGREEGESV